MLQPNFKSFADALKGPREIVVIASPKVHSIRVSLNLYTCSDIGELRYEEGCDPSYDKICEDAVALCHRETKGPLEIALKGSAKDYVEQEAHPFDLLHVKEILVSQVDRNETAICPGCFELRGELKRLTERHEQLTERHEQLAERLERNHVLGIVRQVAINIEFELKLRILELVPKFQEDFVDEEDVLDEQRLCNTSLTQCVRAAISAGKFSDFNDTFCDGNFKKLSNVLKLMKNNFVELAHPIERTDGCAMDFEYCATLVRKISSTENQDLVLRQLEKLRISRAVEEDSFLRRY